MTKINFVVIKKFIKIFNIRLINNKNIIIINYLNFLKTEFTYIKLNIHLS